MPRTSIRYPRALHGERALSRRRCWKHCLCGVAAWVLFLVAAGVVRPEFIYFSTDREIWRANLDGTGITRLVNGLSRPSGPALDFAGGMIWADFYGGDIKRANVDGTGQTSLITGLGAPFVPALDLAGGQMYFTDFSGGHILRANLDGTGLTTLVGPLNYPHPVAVDIAGGKMYWSDGNHPSVPYQGESISRANLDGSGQELIVPGAGGPGTTIALDVAAGKMYWVHMGIATGTGGIRRANLDGTSQEVLVSNLVGPFGLALDVARGKMYWGSGTGGNIWRANLDGTGQETLITGLGNPWSIALDLGTPGPAVFYALAAPGRVPSGTAFDLTITAADPYGNIDVNYQGTVTFATSDTDPGIVLPADYTFTPSDAGVHTFSGAVTLNTPGDQTLTVTDTASGIPGSATITVVPPN